MKLQDDKYYIGKSKNTEERIKSHFNNVGTKWTIIHKPIAIVSIFKTTDPFDEDNYTKKFMYKYGIDNVRGGSYTTTELEPTQIALLQREFATVDDKCFKCFQKHLASKCTQTLPIGKYKDLLMSDVYHFDKDYLKWLFCQNFISKELKKELKKILKEDFRKCSQCTILYPEYHKDVKGKCSKCFAKLKKYSIPFLRCDYCIKHNLPKSRIYGDGLCCSCGHML